MGDERRYTDEEVREILTRATDVTGPPSRSVPGPTESTGLTLTELKEVGREVGIDATDIERAAASLERGGRLLPRKRLLGMSVGVGRIVELPRPLTDREWDILVSELRATFEAKGRVESHGDLRSWTNSRLHAHVEPTPDGHRLRLGTVKGNAYIYEALGFGGVFMALVSLMANGVTGGIDQAIMLGGMGLAALVANRIRLPLWAGRREEQMEHIAGRALELVEGEGGSTGG